MLLSIAYHETNFRNIREKGMNIGKDNIEWIDFTRMITSARPSPSTVNQAVLGVGVLTRDQYELAFANEKGTHGLNKEAGVGPMQLSSRVRKTDADDFYSNYAKGGGSSADFMEEGIKRFLTRKLSPLKDFAHEHVVAGKKYNVDPRFVVAISGGETNFATDPNADGVSVFNAWGYAPGKPEGTFSSWPDGIDHVTWVLGKGNYYIKDGNTTVKSIGKNWAPIGAGNDPDNLNANWIPTVSGFLTDLGGDPENVVYPPQATDKLPDHGHDEYRGGRWDPEANINIGARLLRDCLDNTHLDPISADQVDAMAYAYTQYATGSLDRDSPLIRVMKKIMNTDPGFLTTTKEAVAAIRQAHVDQDDGITDGTEKSGSGEPGDPTENEAIAAFQDYAATGPGSKGDPRSGPVFPGATLKLPQITFLQSKNYVSGRTHPILWIVIHTMEIEETDHTADDLANQYATGSNVVAVHYCIDNDSIIQCVKDTDTGRGILVADSGHPAGASGNDISISVEHAGWAKRTAAEWADKYHQDMLKLSAQLVGVRCKQYGLQRKRLSQAEIQAGDSGIVAHGDIYAVYQEGDVRTDPGPNFPWTQYIGWVKDAAGDT